MLKYEMKTLSELSTDGKGHYGIAAPAVEYSESLPTYLRITDINDNGTIDYSGLKSVSDDNASDYFLKANDIVFARTGASTGRNYFYDGTGGKFVYAGFLIKFSIDEKKVNPKHVKYYCMSKSYRDWVSSFSSGSTRGNINAQTYGNMPILLPSRPQQDFLVKVLSALDDKIELNNQINKNLEEQANALFDNMFPNISQGNKTVGDYIAPKRGKSLLSKDAVLGDVPVVAGGLDPSTYHNESNTTAPVITISASGANAGYVSLWHIPVWSSDSSYIDSKMSDSVYFWYVLLKKRQREIYDSQTGSAQPHIYPQHIAVLPVSELSVESISLFNTRVTSLFAQIANNKAENAILHKTRDTILPKLMSGEIDVDNVEI